MYFIWSLNSHFRWIQPSAERVGDTSDAFIILGPSSRTGTSHQLNLGGLCKIKPVLLPQHPAAVLSALLWHFWLYVGWEFTSFLMPPTGSFICPHFPLWSGPGLPQVLRRHQVAPVSSRSKHGICWKTTQPKQRSEQKLIRFSTWKPCFDSLPGWRMTGASSVPCTPHNPKWPKHGKFIIKCVQLLRTWNLKEACSLGLSAGKAMFSPQWQSSTLDLGILWLRRGLPAVPDTTRAVPPRLQQEAELQSN